MKRTLIAAALIAASLTASAGCTSGKDSYKGEDKAIHFVSGGLIAFGTTLGTKSPWVGFAAGSAVGLLKELDDRSGSGQCSGKDLGVTVLGAALGAFAGSKVLVYQQRGTTVVAYRTEF
jgi:uncharacterized protein YfiM (DUF2279 family)